TMERPSREENKTDDKLQQQYMHLQQEWDSIKQAHPRPRILCRSLTYSNTSIDNTIQVLEYSPRNIMTFLQHKRSPLWKVGNNDLAVEEILRDRRAAIESGKLKGRRLFEAVEGVTEVGYGGREEVTGNWWHGLVQDSEVRSSVSCYESADENENCRINDGLFPVCFQHVSCSSTSSTSLCGDNVEKEVEEGDKVVAIMEEKRGACGCGERRRWVVVMVWLAIALIGGAVGIISMAMKNTDENMDQNVILVPT
ncbi:hypothetical protein CFOL_v3_33756, partial [Cephalotus follicularis]